MIFGKVILAALVISTAFYSSEIYAQTSKSPQKISISKDDQSAIFKEGETTIVEIKFVGLDSDYEDYGGAVGTPIYESDILLTLRGNRAMISADEKFNSEKIEKIIRLLKKELTAIGYLKASVVALGEKLPKNRMKLIFSVERGAMIRVSEIRFAGNINITSEELINDFMQCSGDSWRIFDERKFNYYSRECSLSLMFSKGYFQSRIRQVKPRLVDDNYIVTIEVGEGLRYRIGEIKIEGAKVFTRKEILEMLGQNEGDVADGKNLQEFVYKKLKKSYADKGYHLYNAEFDPEYIAPLAEGLDAAVNIKITIDEGKVFKISKIRFIGIEKEKEQQVKENFPLKDGDIFSQSEFEKGLKKLADSKEFYPVEIDTEVELRTNEEDGEVFVIVKLHQVK